MKQSNCRSCGESIIWAVLPSGKKCPMDAQQYNKATMNTERIAVYSLDEIGNDVVATKLERSELLESTQFYVSHFGTCPNAQHHSRKGGK